MASQLFEEFAERIAALPDRRLTTGDLLTDAFLLDQEGELGVYYVPFEQINEVHAKTECGLAMRSVDPDVKGGLAHRHIIDGRDDAVDAGKLANKKSLNVALLGALSAHLPLPEKEWLEALREAFPPDSFGHNQQAFRTGRASQARAERVECL